MSLERLERDEHGFESVVGGDGDSVGIERVDQATGWAVYSGCDGEDPTFVAFFARRDMAELYIKACQADSDADWYMTDPDLAPAVLDDREILVANHFDNAKGAEAVILVNRSRHEPGLSDFDVERFREEARGG